MQDHHSPTLRRSLVAALLALTPLALAPLADARGDVRPAQNRYVVMHMGGESGGAGLNGAFSLDDVAKRASYRSTALESGDITSVWLYYNAVGSPGALRVGLSLDDGSGLPIEPLPDAAGSFLPITGANRWVEVPLDQPVTVQRGDVVHVTIRPRPSPGAGFGPNDYVDLISARSRFPVPYMPAPGPAPGSLVGSSPYDPAATLLFDDGSGVGLVQLRQSYSSFQPVYLLQTSDGRFLGQPYDRHIEYAIGGNRMFGQEVTFDSNVSFDYVATFVRQETPADPTGHLMLSIYQLDAQGAATLQAQSLLARNDDTLYFSRSHWFGTYLDPGFTFQAGRTYVLALGMAGAGPGYVFSTEHCSLPASLGIDPAAIPSYLGEQSRAVRSLNGGQTFHRLRAPSDAAFVLGRYGAPHRAPIGVMDELEARTADDGDPATDHVTYPYAAVPGDVIGLSVVGRNIGLSTGPVGWPTLFAVARDVETGAVVAQADYAHVPQNLEVSRCMNVTMLDVPVWRLTIEVGHYEAGGAMVSDDVVPIEIRRAPEPHPTNLDFLDCSQAGLR